MLRMAPNPISTANAARLQRSTVHHHRATGLWSMRANLIGTVRKSGASDRA
jgi:hypothetical protein